eukprot:SAG22_NODE_1225_length_5115_cov_1.965510_2_plen_73_part_00
MTREAFENAIVVLYALGGSTNGVLHLLALAKEAGLPLQIDEFNRLGRDIPMVGRKVRAAGPSGTPAPVPTAI